MGKSKLDWSIILPVLNEGENLGPLLEAILLLPLARRAEIIVVDSGSTDSSHDAYLHVAAKYKKTPIRWLEAPPGKGVALRLAFERARGKFIAFMDSDGQYLPSGLAAVCRALENRADLVVTHRRARNTNPLRRALSLGYARLIGRYLLGLPARDPQSGLKAFRADLLHGMKLTAKHWDLDSQLIAGAERAGATIEEVDIEFLPRSHGRTKTGLVSTSVNLLTGALRQSCEPPRH